MNKFFYSFCLVYLSAILIVIVIEMGAINHFLSTKKTENQFLEKQIVGKKFPPLSTSAKFSLNVCHEFILHTLACFILLILFKNVTFYEEVISESKQTDQEEMRRRPKSFFESKNTMLFLFSFIYLWLNYDDIVIALVFFYFYLKLAVWLFEIFGVYLVIIPIFIGFLKDNKVKKFAFFGLDKLNNRESIIESEIFSHLKELKVEYEIYKVESDVEENVCVNYISNKASIIIIGNIEKLFTKKELTAVLYHEIGHIVQNTTINRLVFTTINSYIAFCLNLLFVNQSKRISNTKFTRAELFFICNAMFDTISRRCLVVINHIYGQYDESQADDYSKSKCNPFYLATALIKIHLNHVSLFIFTKGYGYLLDNHPNLLDRLENLGFK
ncbi:CAAX prenyl protease 1 like protein [Nosema granulosis]|uniref:CAAX prenyl protease 1 like protein n=1 Tax=Nosema granulosis TaxID=83296 RepID=A0A9P6GVN4_9MICR|nr:CAAX prenyl protease 1 like protein [Nosema granulosis]